MEKLLLYADYRLIHWCIQVIGNLGNCMSYETGLQRTRDLREGVEEKEEIGTLKYFYTLMVSA